MGAGHGDVSVLGVGAPVNMTEPEEKYMSIATTRGDGGQTGLAGGIRVSKASLRVDTYGNVDELISTLGFARSICDDREIAEPSDIAG